METAQEYFWGVELNKDQPTFTWSFEEDEDDNDYMVHTLFLKSAVLGTSAVKGERNVVQIETKNFDKKELKQPLLSLTLGQTDMCNLDISFGNEVQATFRLVEGAGPISLCGQQLVEFPPEELNSQDESALEETIESDLTEEEDSPKKSKKRKAAAGADKKSKKGKMEESMSSADDSAEDEEDEDEEEDEEEDMEEDEDEDTSPEKGGKKGKKTAAKKWYTPLWPPSNIVTSVSPPTLDGMKLKTELPSVFAADWEVTNSARMSKVDSKGKKGPKATKVSPKKAAKKTTKKGKK